MNILSSFSLGLLVACGDGAGCSVTSEFVYPRTHPDAALTAHSLRARVSDSGFDAFERMLPGLIEGACAGGTLDGASSCAYDPVVPNRVRFFLGDGSTFTTTSYIAIDVDSLTANINLSLAPDGADGPGGIRVTLGCAAGAANCPNEDTISGSLDMLFVGSALGFSAACDIDDATQDQTGLRVVSFVFVYTPNIVLDGSGDPIFVFEDSDLRIEYLDLDTTVSVVRNDAHPNCGTGCGTVCTSANVAADVFDFLTDENGFAQPLAAQIIRLFSTELADQPLSGEGVIDLYEVFPAGLPYAETVAYRVAANADTEAVTGVSGALGFNVDFDAGAFAVESPCVPEIAALDFTLPPVPDPDALVRAPDPVTGEMMWEPYDVGVLLGDSLLRRTMFSFFSGGGLCLLLEGNDDAAPDAPFIPTVATFALLAPGFEEVFDTDAPVDMRISPKLPPTFYFGPGIQSGGDSHLTMVWPDVRIELLPRIDDLRLRAFEFAADLSFAASIEPLPDSQVSLTIDGVVLDNVVQTYDELGIQVDAAGVESIIGALLPTLLADQAMQFDFSEQTAGFPIEPKMRAVRLEGPEERYLGLYFKLCVLEDIGVDPLCDAGLGPTNSASTRHALHAFGIDAQRGRVTLAAQSSLASEIQLAFRVEGNGPYFSFRAANADQRFILDHPAFSIPGFYSIELLARDEVNPNRFSEPAFVNVEIAGKRWPQSLDLRASMPSATDNPYGEGPRSATSSATPTPSTYGCASTQGGGLAWVGILLLLLPRRRGCF